MAWVFRDDLKYSPAGSAKFRWNNNNTEIRYSWLASFDKNAPEKWLILISHAICLTNACETWKTLEKRKKKEMSNILVQFKIYYSLSFVIVIRLQLYLFLEICFSILSTFCLRLIRNFLFKIHSKISSDFSIFQDIQSSRLTAKHCYSYYNDTRKSSIRKIHFLYFWLKGIAFFRNSKFLDVFARIEMLHG